MKKYDEFNGAVRFARNLLKLHGRLKLVVIISNKTSWQRLYTFSKTGFIIYGFGKTVLLKKHYHGLQLIRVYYHLYYPLFLCIHFLIISLLF